MIYYMVGRVGVEPTSPVFQTGAVTTLATAPQVESIWSGKRGSNPRPPPWQGGALPLSYSRSKQKLIITKIFPYLLLIIKSFRGKIRSIR